MKDSERQTIRKKIEFTPQKKFSIADHDKDTRKVIRFGGLKSFDLILSFVVELPSFSRPERLTVA